MSGWRAAQLMVEHGGGWRRVWRHEGNSSVGNLEVATALTRCGNQLGVTTRTLARRQAVETTRTTIGGKEDKSIEIRII